MYQAGPLAELLRARRDAPAPGVAWVSKNVVLLGLTSLVTDVSSEMVAAVLPIYLVYSLELSPLVLGVLDGLYHGASLFVRVATGLVADRWRRLKEIATLGYVLSAVCKLGLVAAGASAPALAAVVVADRTGKGIRAAPRDALVSLGAPPGALGAAFGLHRMLDTIGATLGPLVAFGLLSLLPGAFHAVFFVAFCIAVVGVAMIALLVETPSRAQDPGDPPPSEAPDRPSMRAAIQLVKAPRFRSLVVLAFVLAAGTLSDGLVYLVLERRTGFGVARLPLLYVASAVAYAVLALPVGRLADRVGRARVLAGGYALVALLYVVLLVGPRATSSVAACVVLLGASYAATDGVLMSLASAIVPAPLRATGLAVVGTCTSAGRLLASVSFGAMWSRWGVDAALVGITVAIAAATVATAVSCARKGATVDHAS